MPKNQNRDIVDVFTKAIEDPAFKLNVQDQIRLDRLKAVFARWMDNPLITNTQMRDFIICNYSVGRTQAYDDISVVKILFGHAPKAEKEFQRKRANTLLEQATACALAGDDKQAKALAKIAETIAKVNKLDEPDGEEYHWEEIVPRDESFSVDPEVIGIKKVPGIEDKARKLLKRYTQEIDTIDEQ